MTRPTNQRIALVVAVAVLAAAGAAWWRVRAARTSPPHYEFANLAPNVKYVGGSACAECHAEIAASYARTSMGLSWGDADRRDVIENYESTGEVEEATLGFRYRAFARDGKFYQEEFRLDDDGRRTHSIVREVRYAVGSGDHGRSYVAEHNGFLTMMPLGWYSSAAAWDMSPGYREGNHRFSREVPLQCTLCHNALPDFVRGSENRYRPPLPRGIDCERCHGPGELHVATHRAGSATTAQPSGEDRTIVNPARVPLERRDDVCFQCHLQSDVSFPASGHDWLDFRPGQALGEFHRDFFEVPENPETFGFASHGPRMRLSACWSNGETRRQMTCISCHDPHVPLAEVSNDHYNRACAKCHTAGDCARPRVEPAAIEPADATGDCVSCHMAKAPPSNVAHVVFTDHWIRKQPKLTTVDPANWHRADPSRPLELIDFWAVDAPASPADFAVAIARLLDRKASLRENHLGRAVSQLESATESDPNNFDVRFWLGAMYQYRREQHSAAASYERAVKLKPDDGLARFSLGEALFAGGKVDAAIRELQRAIELAPDYLPTYSLLATIEQQRRNPAQAVASIDAALARYPHQTELLARRAALLFASEGPNDVTLAAVRKAIGADPDNAQLVRILVQMQLARGQTDAAIATYRRIIARFPKSIPLLLSLGKLLAERGCIDEADELLSRLRELSPNHPAIPNIERELQQRRAKSEEN